ncbi:MAG: ABC transporter permease [Anaerolineae bacterium]
MKVWLIAEMTFHEARQRRLVWIGAVLGLLFLGVFALGYYFMYQDVARYAGPFSTQVIQAANGFALMGLYAVNFLGVMLAVVISVDTLSGEISSGTIQTIVTKPLRRWEIVVGKWLGLLAMLSLFILFLCAGLVLITWLIARHIPLNIIPGTALMILCAAVVMTLSLLGSTHLAALANGVLVLMLYGLAFAAGWVEEFGAIMHNPSAVQVGIVVSLLVPAEAMWKRAAYLMQPGFLREFGMSPFGAGSAPSTAMVIYTLLYVLAGLAAAVRLFQRRDL